MKYTMGTTADPEFAIPIEEAESADQAKTRAAKSRCVLNVTEQEYAKILQLNHDALVWNSRDKELAHGLELLLGEEIAELVGKFEECRMEKHNDLAGIPRVQAV